MPASTADAICAACVALGLARYTASTSGAARSSSTPTEIPGAPMRSANDRAREASREQTRDTAVSSTVRTAAAKRSEMELVPTMPKRIIPSSCRAVRGWRGASRSCAHRLDRIAATRTPTRGIMTVTRAEHRRRLSRRVRLRRTIVATAAVALIVGGVTVLALTRGPSTAPVADTTPSSSSSGTPTPPPPPASPAQELLRTATDPKACAVSFVGDGITLDPELQTQDLRYEKLPLPRADGRVFAGWYSSAADATALNTDGRINGADLVACTQRQRTLYAGWTTPEANAAQATELPILMYHQFTQKPEGEDNWLRGNYAYIGDFDAQMAHIQEERFYLPTWDEVDAFIDGALFLPKRSVVITDDDADSTWLSMAAPIVDARNLLTTSFVITSARSEPTPNRFVLQRSHTHDMHRAGANGKGRLVNEDADTIAADLETSAQILGAKEVVAYPFGHYDDTTKEGVRRAGFALGRGIEPGYVRIGTDKLALPVVRIDYGMTVDDLRAKIG